MTSRLADVAKQVGVSQATVSRVLNDKPGISEATRQAVLTALDVLGYERPVKLRGARARLVGLVLPELQSPIFPAYTEVMAGALAKQGFSPVLCTGTTDGVAEAEYVTILFEQQVSGVIFAGGLHQYAAADHDHYRRLVERSLPAVLINAGIDGLALPRVSTDDAHAIDQAHGHLAALGHEHIGLLLGPDDHQPSLRRLAAQRARAGHREELVGHATFTMEDGQAVASRLLALGATALICASDVLALGAVRAARRLGLAVPDDVSIIGHGDSAVTAHTDPPLTTIREPVEAMGRAAVGLLIAQIAREPVALDELLHEPELVVRASTGARVWHARRSVS